MPLSISLGACTYQALTSSATPRKEASSSIPSILITVLSTSKQTASASRQISLEVSSVIFETCVAILISFVILVLSSESSQIVLYILEGAILLATSWFLLGKKHSCRCLNIKIGRAHPQFISIMRVICRHESHRYHVHAR